MILELYELDMLGISKKINEFYDKYGSGQNWNDFDHDIINLIILLKHRIRSEEGMFYEDLKKALT